MCLRVIVRISWNTCFCSVVTISCGLRTWYFVSEDEMRLQTRQLCLLISISLLLAGCGTTNTNVPPSPPSSLIPPIDPSLPIEGTWRNELGSEMWVKYDGITHSLTGTYQNHGGGTSGHTHYPLSGIVNGNLLTFSVNWNLPAPDAPDDHIAAITSWNGEIYKDEHGTIRIRTVWLLSFPRKFVWDGVKTGADVFEPTR